MIFRFVALMAVFGVLLTGIVQAEELNPVVGKTGDFVLREADFDRLFGNLSVEAQKAIQGSEEQKNNFIRQLLLTKATAAKARKEGFDRKPEFKELVSNLIDQYLAQEYLNKVVVANVAVTDEEMKKYYADHEKDLVVPEAVKVRHVFISSPRDSAVELREKAKAKAKAEGILQQIKNGAALDKIAREQSEDTDSAAKGGDLGYISAGKTNSQEFEKAVLALKPGAAAQLIETPFGYHVVMVDDRKEQRTVSFEEAKEYLQNLLREQNKQKAAKEFLDRITKETGLEVTGEKSGGAK